MQVRRRTWPCLVHPAAAYIPGGHTRRALFQLNAKSISMTTVLNQHWRSVHYWRPLTAHEAFSAAFLFEGRSNEYQTRLQTCCARTLSNWSNPDEWGQLSITVSCYSTPSGIIQTAACPCVASGFLSGGTHSGTQQCMKSTLHSSKRLCLSLKLIYDNLSISPL